jgi:hypothetical protein
VSIQGSDSNEGHGLGVDSDDNIYLAGRFSGTADFDPGGGVHTVTSDGFDDAYVAKLDRAGTLVWAHTFGGSSYIVASKLAVDAAGNVYMSGRFSGTIDVDPGPGVMILVLQRPHLLSSRSSARNMA